MDFKDLFKDPEDREPNGFDAVERSGRWSSAAYDPMADFEAAKKAMRDQPMRVPERHAVIPRKVHEWIERDMERRGARTFDEWWRMCWDELTDDQKEGIMEELWRSPYENAF